MRRAIQWEIEGQLSEKILFGGVGAGRIVLVDVEGFDPESESDDEAKFTSWGEFEPVTVPARRPRRVQ